MTRDYFYNFKKHLYEAESGEEQSSISDLEKVLKNSPKVTYTLMRLLTTQTTVGEKALSEIRDVLSDVKIITFRPTTFRVIFKNSNYFDLVYDPSPLEVKNEQEVTPSDLFRVVVMGKRYDLANKSSFEQALDYIGICMKNNPIDSNNPDTQQAADETGGELPTETDKPAK